MPTGQVNRLIRHLRQLAQMEDGREHPDRQLLESFLVQRDESAFAALVRRHGPMVLAVCRRVLGNVHDAEDAFQATFLVLLRKATSISKRDLLSNWLFGVAYRTAMKAKAVSAKRREKEASAQGLPAKKPAGEDWHELLPLLDHELNRLPDKYRAPVVLCDLEGKTRKEAARLLSIPEGTLSTRLFRGRALLARKLSRHGLGLSAGSLAALLSEQVASASVPTALAASTVGAATLWVAGKTTAGAISAKVLALTEGVLKSMLLTRLKISLVVFLIVAVVGGGLGVRSFLLPAAEQPQRQEKGNDTSRAKDPEETDDDSNLAWERLGLKLERVAASEVTEANRQLHGGMKVLAVRPESQAARQEVRKGDILVGLDHWETTTEDSVPFVLGFCQGREIRTVRYFLVRQKKIRSGVFSLEPVKSKESDLNLRKIGDPVPPPAPPSIAYPPVAVPATSYVPVPNAPLFTPPTVLPAGVIQSRNFIVRAPTEELASKIADQAEKARKELAITWLGKELSAWADPTVIWVRLTDTGSGGATAFSFDRGKVTSQDMHIEGSADTLCNTLTHEVMHTVLAHHFGKPLPRWVDEGVAMMAESTAEQKRHEGMMGTILETPQRLIPLRKLFTAMDFPRDVTVLYAEGLAVTRFLVEAKDRETLLKFVGQGMEEGWDKAVKTHYGYTDVDALEKAWLIAARAHKKPA